MRKQWVYIDEVATSLIEFEFFNALRSLKEKVEDCNVNRVVYFSHKLSSKCCFQKYVEFWILGKRVIGGAKLRALKTMILCMKISTKTIDSKVGFKVIFF